MVLALALCACGARRGDPAALSAMASLPTPVGAAAPADLAAIGPDDAARLMVAQNPRVQALVARIGAARAESFAGATLPDLELGTHVHLPAGQDPTIHEVEATIDVVGLLTLPARRVAAGGSLDADTADAAADLVGLVAGARVAAVDAQHAHAALDAEHARSEAAGAAAEVADRLLAAGNITQREDVARHLAADRAHADAIQAAHAVVAADLRLATRLGVGLDAPLPPLAGFAPPDDADPAGLEETAVQASLRRIAAEERVHAAGAARTAAALGVLPSVGLGYGAEQEASGWVAGPAIALRVPIGGASIAEARRAGAASRVARYAAAAVEAEVRAEARIAVDALQAARATWAIFAAPVAPDLALDQALREYNAMSTGVFDLLDARMARAEAELARLDALRGLWHARIAADALAAGGSSASEDEP
jgi:outer membrane protein TolC